MKYIKLVTLFLFLFIFPLHVHAQNENEGYSGIVPEPETAVFKGANITFERTISCSVYDSKGKRIPFEAGIGKTCLQVQNISVPTINQTIFEIDKAVKEARNANPPTQPPYVIREEITLNWIGQAIQALYVASISIATVLSVLALMWAGILWISAGGNQSTIGKAREYISNAIIGLILVFGSYLILFTLNPDTANIRGITLTKVANVTVKLDKLLDIENVESGLTKPLRNDATQEQIEQRQNILGVYQAGFQQAAIDGYGASCEHDPNICSTKYSSTANTCRSSFDKSRFCCKNTGVWADECIMLIPPGGECEASYMCAQGIYKSASYNAGDRRTCCAYTGQRSKPNNNYLYKCMYAEYNGSQWRTIPNIDGQPGGQPCEGEFASNDGY